ncbi:MAG: hypothetical protein JO208_13275 [Alphaproteobacteria bacterium]|nr:hypothetical protein [Alphaproteobacteria bacterium]
MSETARWLREASGADRVAALGIGLGSLLAGEAIRAGASIDDLILWAAPAQGRSYLRELRLYSSAILGDEDEPGPDSPVDAISMGGFLLSRESMDAISAARATLDDPAGRGRRVLMIGRDSGGVDETLRASLVEGGADVTVVSTEGEYAAMMTSPDVSRLPTRTIGATVKWLTANASPGVTPRPLADAPGLSNSVSFEHEGQIIREQHVTLETAAGALVGILSQPVSCTPEPLCIITHNAGALRRTSPGRSWTELCRHSAARGLSALRVDLEGIGDSPGQFAANTRRGPEDEQRTITSRMEIADILERDQVASRFIGVGQCLGAYWEMKAAVRDPRVRGIMLLNHLAFDWTPQLMREREMRAALGPLRRALSSGPRALRQLLTVESIRTAGRGTALLLGGSVRAARRAQLSPALSQCDRLSSSGTRVLMMFSRNEVLFRQIRDLGLLKISAARWPGIAVETLDTADHELRAARIRADIHERFDVFVDQVLEADLRAYGR